MTKTNFFIKTLSAK